METESNWASSDFISNTFALNRSDFAFEFLRRNLKYQIDYVTASKEGPAAAPLISSFPAKWGLIFSDRSLEESWLLPPRLAPRPAS
ncbi:transcriptional regulator domain-containing protein [Neorhizobium sp. DT-125]|uniref:transcriptional regulator domain-containing protein n=1 Tax=Neorhizobium sp. DT-125 TaxID=3396163 RepID=UPI003F1D036D